jgi:hypothetical protein
VAQVPLLTAVGAALALPHICIRFTPSARSWCLLRLVYVEKSGVSNSLVHVAVSFYRSRRVLVPYSLAVGAISTNTEA